MLEFSKMNGAGNDFVVIDNRDLSHPLSKQEIERICQRQRGVGADGLLAVEPAENGADYKMRYYNADGGEAEMCGNGARCFARFVNRMEGGTLARTRFETIAGTIEAEFIGEEVKIELSKPFDLALGLELEIGDSTALVHSLNTGVPHAVLFVEDLEKVDVQEWGAAVRYHDQFSPAGTNVNFVEIREPGMIAIRTYERGVENETLACGTGMVACAILHHELSQVPTPIRVQVAGGDILTVEFDREAEGEYRNVTLLGPADFTFDGTLSTL